MPAAKPTPLQLSATAAAAFCTYFCMYAFRKPFTAGTFEGEYFLGCQLKAALVISQLLGYLLSKFIGIKVISEMRGGRCAAAIIGLVFLAELALVGFAFAPAPLNVAMMFLNGLPLGMIFGLILCYLEGRRQTEALSAALCASFIAASGFVKSVGRWLIEDLGVTEYQAPMLAGLMFFPPLLLSVCLLHTTPPPDEVDRRLRQERNAMDRSGRRRFLAAYWPGLSLLVFVFAAVTVIRTIRDDFAVEIWRDLGVSETPSIFARTEGLVAICVTVLNGLAVWVEPNLKALRITLGLMCAALVVVAASALLQTAERITPFCFMLTCGVGLYIPYVAFHTTVFERLIAASRRPCNLGFLLYFADAVGYLGYAVVIVAKAMSVSPGGLLPFFLSTSLVVAGLAVAALIAASFYFQKKLAGEAQIWQIGAQEISASSPADDEISHAQQR